MNRPNLKPYIFTSFEDLKKWIDQDEKRLWNYQRRIESLLDAIPPGGMIDVLQYVRPNSYEPFTLLASFYMRKEIIEKGILSERTFYRDDNYTIIERLKFSTPVDSGKKHLI